MAKVQSARSLCIRAAQAEREANQPRCPEHGHRVTSWPAVNMPYRFACGCKTGEVRGF